MSCSQKSDEFYPTKHLLNQFRITGKYVVPTHGKRTSPPSVLMGRFGMDCFIASQFCGQYRTKQFAKTGHLSVLRR